MGLFDHFRKEKQEPQQNDSTESERSNQPYLGDLQKTQLVFELIGLPAGERSETWQRDFLENIVQASFRCGEPQVITGPDGFPYFQLLMPKPNERFQCYVIDRMKDDFLLKLGYGVVINPDKGQPDWVLTYGDILNLHLNGSFYTTEPTPFSRAVEDEMIENEENVLVGQPSDQILPELTRAVLNKFLTNSGVKSPKVLLMCRTATDGTVSQDLVFNLTPDDFETEAHFRSVMQHLGWFLPRHYSFVAMAEQQFEDSFMAL